MSAVADRITAALLRFGRPMVLRRTALGPGGMQSRFDVTVYGVSENYAPEELTGSFVQGDSRVTISNAQIAAAQWPGPPRDGDSIIIDGKTRAITSDPEQVHLGVDLIVFYLHVKG